MTKKRFARMFTVLCTMVFMVSMMAMPAFATEAASGNVSSAITSTWTAA